MYLLYSDVSVYFCLIILQLSVIGLIQSKEINEDGSVNYCQWEKFEPVCPPGHAILMRKALYGRLTTGQCISRDYGYIGCSTDVLHQADYRCSGQTHCSIEIPYKVFDTLNDKDCPDDLRRFLQAKYECIPVVFATRSTCMTEDYKVSAINTGYLASAITDQSGCGSTDIPWVVTALPGQRLNITLYDFSLTSVLPNVTTRHYSSEKRHCHVYAIVKEKDGSGSFSICGGEARISHVYLSSTNVIEIRMLGGRNSRTARHYMLHYEAIGCPDPFKPVGGWIEKTKDNDIIGGCNGNENSLWKLTCENGKWSGKLGNCTGGEFPEAMLSLGALSHGTSLVLITLIALFIGLIVLFIGLICLKRYYPRRNRPNKTMGQSVRALPQNVIEQKYDATMEYPKQRSQPLINYQESNPHLEENEYAYIEDVIPPPIPQHYNRDKNKIKNNSMINIDYRSTTNDCHDPRQNCQSAHRGSSMTPHRYQIELAPQAGDPGVLAEPVVVPVTQPQYFVLAPNSNEPQYSVNKQMLPYNDPILDYTDPSQQPFAL